LRVQLVAGTGIRSGVVQCSMCTRIVQRESSRWGGWHRHCEQQQQQQRKVKQQYGFKVRWLAQSLSASGSSSSSSSSRRRI
jgi:hypothetical protein